MSIHQYSEYHVTLVSISTWEYHLTVCLHHTPGYHLIFVSIYNGTLEYHLTLSVHQCSEYHVTLVSISTWEYHLTRHLYSTQGVPFDPIYQYLGVPPDSESLSVLRSAT